MYINDYDIFGDTFNTLAYYASAVLMAQVLLVIAAIVLSCIAYFVSRHVLYTLGKKAGLGNGWMAFVPVARAIYLCKLANMNIAFFLLLSKTVIFVISFLLYVILTKLSFVFAAIVIAVYAVAAWITEIITHMRVLKRFGFNVCGAFLPYPVNYALDAVMAYSNYEDREQRDIMTSVDGRELKSQIMSDVKQFIQSNNASEPSGRVVQGGTISRSPDGRIIGVSGKYVGVTFDIQNGEQFKFGRSADKSNIVFDSTDADISREHCIVRYANGLYQVTDISTNGTYLEDGTPIGRGNTVNVAPGRVILLGKQKKNSFRLG